MTSAALLHTLPDVFGVGLRIGVDGERREDALAAVADEIERLRAVFSPLSPDSEFNRWRRGEIADAMVSAELAYVLAASERFWVFSRGAFHPGAATLVDRWRLAEAEGILPSRDELRDLARRLELPYTAVNGPIVRTGDCARVDLNSIARGFVLDAALAAGWRVGGIESLTLESGNDHLHRGSGGIPVVLRDVRSGLEAAPALVTLHVSNASLSRSPSPCAGFSVAGRVYRDVLDPLTGWPGEGIVGVAALAPDSMTADVLATVVGAGQNPAGGFSGCAWATLRADGGVHFSDGWPHVGRTTAS